MEFTIGITMRLMDYLLIYSEQGLCFSEDETIGSQIYTKQLRSVNLKQQRQIIPALLVRLIRRGEVQVVGHLVWVQLKT